MIRVLAAPRTAARWIAIGTMILGCATPPVGDLALVRPSATYDGAWSTPLPPGVSSNPDSFRIQVAALGLLSGPTYTRLRAADGCDGCAVFVRVKALGNTRKAIGSGQSRIGRPVAHIVNLDRDHVEAYYGLKPGRNADYFFWIDRRPDVDSARITLLEVPHLGLVRAGRQKNLHSCEYYRHLDDEPYEGVDFVEYRHPDGCAGSRRYMAHSTLGEPSFLSANFVANLANKLAGLIRKASMASGEGWIDCNSGCCT